MTGSIPKQKHCIACGVELEPGWHFAHCGRKECMTPISSKTMTLADAVTEVKARFVSANSIPVERASIKRPEWDVILAEVEASKRYIESTDKVLNNFESENERLRAALEHIRKTGYGLEMNAGDAERAEYWGDLAMEYRRIASEALSGDSSAPETSEEAWLFECSRPGHRMAFASIDKDDSTWWPRDQWKLVTRMPLISLGQREVLWGNPPAQETKPGPYKAVCQGGTGGKCTDPDCEKCWPDQPEKASVHPACIWRDGCKHPEVCNANLRCVPGGIEGQS